MGERDQHDGCRPQAFGGVRDKRLAVKGRLARPDTYTRSKTTAKKALKEDAAESLPASGMQSGHRIDPEPPKLYIGAR